MAAGDFLWNALIPVVVDFDYSTALGSAVARELQDEHVELVIVLTKEDSDRLKSFLEDQIPVALSWTTKKAHKEQS